METDEIKKFPSLMKSEYVKEELQGVIDAEAKLKLEKAQLQWTINSIQENCQHVWKEERKYDKSIASCSKGGGNIYHGLDVLESKTCTLCGLKKEKPNGFPFVTCHSCWSPMKYHSTIPGQGEHTSVFECTNPKCNTGSWHT